MIALSNKPRSLIQLTKIITAPLNTLRPRQNRRHFADDIFKCIFLNENVWTSINISVKFVPKGPINHIPALVQIMAWRRPGDKPLSEPMMISLPTHICVTRPQWVNNTTNMETRLSKSNWISEDVNCSYIHHNFATDLICLSMRMDSF